MDKGRVSILSKHFSKKILELFQKDIPTELTGKEPISYNEAVEVLNYTISELGNKSFVN